MFLEFAGVAVTPGSGDKSDIKGSLIPSPLKNDLIFKQCNIVEENQKTCVSALALL